MKFFSLIFIMGFYSINSWAYTANGSGAANAVTTRAAARTALAAAKTATKITSTTTQAYTDCGGCPIPNDTGAMCLACPGLPGI